MAGQPNGNSIDRHTRLAVPAVRVHPIALAGQRAEGRRDDGSFDNHSRIAPSDDTQGNLHPRGPVLCYPVRIRVVGDCSVTTFTANEVFTDIDEIAHSGDLLRERQTRAEMRINEFESDLAKRHLALDVAEKIRRDLQSKLEGAIRNRDVIGDFDAVFRSALDRLSGEES